MCSSTASVLGGRGKIVYAAANRMLDAHARQLRAEGRDCVSVQWGQWAVYQGQDSSDIANLAGVGYLPMRSTDAITLGLSGLPGNVAVAAFDWDRARAVFGTLGYGPTLSQLVSRPTNSFAELAAPTTDVDGPAAAGAATARRRYRRRRPSSARQHGAFGGAGFGLAERSDICGGGSRPNSVVRWRFLTFWAV